MKKIKNYLMVSVLLFLVSFAYGQEKTISGTVNDEDNEPLLGVFVEVKGTTNGTTTDEDGKYELSGVTPVDTLRFSYVGFKETTVQIGEQEEFSLNLESEASALDETVIIGFGKQKKEDMVGSVTTINPSELRVPSSNLTTSLAGRMAGVIGFQRSGEPGMDDADFFIRGVTSFGAGKKDPLILIDGMELSTTELARLRPDDIENFSILKDATATAVYGSRAANGVILVETKEGKEGKPEISLRAEASSSTPTTDVEFADPVTYMQLYNEAEISRDPSAIALYSQEKIDRTAEGKFPTIFPAVDWKKKLFKKQTFNHRYNLNVKGGGKVARYYVAGSYAQDNGVLKVDGENNFNNNIDLKSYTLRANVNIDLTESTELIVRLNGNFDDYNGPIEGGEEVYNQVVKSSPVDFLPSYPKEDEHEHVQHIMFGRPAEDDRSFTNPYANMVRGYKDYTRSLMMAQMELKQDLSFLTKGLNFRAMFNTNRNSRFEIVRKYNPFYYGVTSYDGRTGDYNLEVFNESSGTEYLDYSVPSGGRIQRSEFYLESAIDYSRQFKDKHTFSGMLVGIMQNTVDAKASSLQLSLPSRNIGLSGRATYSYDDRYYAEFNFGYNGSERFHKSRRFGFFPSYGLGWTISNENFWESLKDKISNFRLRATYGLTGNDQIGASSDRFFYISEVDMDSGSNSYRFGKESPRNIDGIAVERYANPDVSWETSYKTNLAVELGLFNKIDIQADFYKEIRKNILMSRADVPATMGLQADIKSNIGEADGKGMDISLEYDDSFANEMWLQVHGNFTYTKNKYRTYEEPEYKKEWWKSKVGQPIDQPMGYIAERLFIDDEDVVNSPPQEFGVENIAGDIKYKDVNGDGRITNLDMVPIGHPTTPEIIYGLGFSFGWKNWDVSTFFQGSAHSSFFVDPSSVQPFVGDKQILKAFADDHFSPENNPDIYAT